MQDKTNLPGDVSGKATGQTTNTEARRLDAGASDEVQRGYSNALLAYGVQASQRQPFSMLPESIRLQGEQIIQTEARGAQHGPGFEEDFRTLFVECYAQGVIGPGAKPNHFLITSVKNESHVHDTIMILQKRKLLNVDLDQLNAGWAYNPTGYIQSMQPPQVQQP